MRDEDNYEQVFLAVIIHIVSRLGIADDAINQVFRKVDSQNSFVGCEVAALQIRKVCEALVIASTSGHKIGDKYSPNEKKWRPGDGFRELAKLNKHPLQIPVDVVLDHGGPGSHHIVPKMRPVSINTLNRVYGLCNDMLHMPTLRNISAGKIAEYDLIKLRDWVVGLSELMMGHVIMLPERETVLLCLWNGNFESEPEVHRLEALGQSTFSLDGLKEFDLFT